MPAMKTPHALPILVALLCSCGTTPQGQAPVRQDRTALAPLTPGEAAFLPSLTVVRGLPSRIDDSELVFLRRVDGKWSVDHTTSRIDGVELQRDDSREAITVDGRNSAVRVAVPRKFKNLDCEAVQPGVDACPCVSGLLGATRKKDGYSLCTSAFSSTTLSGMNAAVNVASWPILLTGTGMTTKYVDVEGLKAALSEAEVAEYLARRSYAQYRAVYSAARTASQLDDFVSRYSRRDPDGLVESAKAKRVQALADQRRMAEESERMNRLEAERAASARQQAMAQAEREREQEASRIRAFRSGLAVGARTNCGPVIEVRSNLLKVYAPVANYGNEHWIERDALFPPGYGCRFLNGRYVGTQ